MAIRRLAATVREHVRFGIPDARERVLHSVGDAACRAVVSGTKGVGLLREAAVQHVYGDRLMRPQARGWLTRELFEREALKDADRLKPPSAYAGDHEFARAINHHIAGLHLDPYNVADTGLAFYDVQKAAYFGVSLDLVVEFCVRMIEGSDEYLREKIRESCNRDRHVMVTPQSYRAWLVRNLMMIEDFGTTQIDWSEVWQRVARVMPDYQQITYSISRDTIDLPFYENA